jgi:hypothetical protein
MRASLSLRSLVEGDTARVVQLSVFGQPPLTNSVNRERPARGAGVCLSRSEWQPRNRMTFAESLLFHRAAPNPIPHTQLRGSGLA